MTWQDGINVIKSLRLENFQSHKDSTFEFDKGLNIIVGSSNQGKTACARALSLVFYNVWDKSWVRVGNDFCRITLKMDTGVYVIREKGDKVNKYKLFLDGASCTEYTNFGTEVPEPVSKFLKIHKIVLDKDDSLTLNYASQLEPLFLFNRSGSQKAKVFGRLSGAHYLDYALRNLNVEKRNIGVEKGLKTKELVELQIQHTALSAVSEFRATINDLEAKNAALDAARQRVEALKSLFSQVQNWKRRYESEIAKETFLSQAKTVEIGSVEASVQRLKGLKQLLKLKSDILLKEKILNDSQNQFEIDLQKEMQTYLTTLSINKVCPTCFNTLDSQKLDEIKNNLVGKEKCLTEKN